MADNNTSQAQNTTNSGSLAQMGSLSEAFSWSDFSNISIEELSNDPAAAKMITILYAQSEKEKKQAEGKITQLLADVKFYRSMQSVSIAFAVVSVIGTIVVGFGISLNMSWPLIMLGSALVLIGEITPRALNKKGEKVESYNNS